MLVGGWAQMPCSWLGADVHIADLEGVHGHGNNGAQMKARALSFSPLPSQGRKGPFRSNSQGQLGAGHLAGLGGVDGDGGVSEQVVQLARLRQVRIPHQAPIRQLQQQEKQLVQLACPPLSVTWFGPTSLQK